MKDVLIIMAAVVIIGLLFVYPTVMMDIFVAGFIMAFVLPLVIGVGGALKENRNQTKDTL